MLSILSRLNRHFHVIALTIGALLTTATALAESPQLNLKRIELSAGMHRIVAQVAADNDTRAIGLMHRREMPVNEGMLFVFERPDRYCFWMKNALIPLNAAFIDDAGVVVNVADMMPQSTQTHCAEKPVRYVLEMNAGWFAKRGFGAGTKIGGLVR
jgi:hypothetical protein